MAPEDLYLERKLTKLWFQEGCVAVFGSSGTYACKYSVARKVHRFAHSGRCLPVGQPHILLSAIQGRMQSNYYSYILIVTLLESSNGMSSGLNMRGGDSVIR